MSLLARILLLDSTYSAEMHPAIRSLVSLLARLVETISRPDHDIRLLPCIAHLMKSLIISRSYGQTMLELKVDATLITLLLGRTSQLPPNVVQIGLFLAFNLAEHHAQFSRLQAFTKVSLEVLRANNQQWTLRALSILASLVNAPNHQIESLVTNPELMSQVVSRLAITETDRELVLLLKLCVQITHFSLDNRLKMVELGVLVPLARLIEHSNTWISTDACAAVLPICLHPTCAKPLMDSGVMAALVRRTSDGLQGQPNDVWTSMSAISVAMTNNFEVALLPQFSSLLCSNLSTRFSQLALTKILELGDVLAAMAYDNSDEENIVPSNPFWDYCYAQFNDTQNLTSLYYLEQVRVSMR